MGLEEPERRVVVVGEKGGRATAIACCTAFSDENGCVETPPLYLELCLDAQDICPLFVFRSLVPQSYSYLREIFKMSRGGRGGGGRGGFGRGRGGFGGGASSMPPMGLTFADIQSLSREEDALYPVRC